MARPTKITEAQKHKAIKLLSQGWSINKAAKAAGVSKSWLSANKPLVEEAGKLKKDARSEFLKGEGERVRGLASTYLDISERAAKALTDEKLNQCSGAALITISGISTDKMQLLTGGATEIVTVENNANLTEKISTSLSANKKGSLTIIEPGKKQNAGTD